MTAFDVVKSLKDLVGSFAGVGLSGKFRVVMAEQDLRSLLSVCREEIQTVRMEGPADSRWELVLGDVPFETDVPLAVANGQFLRDLYSEIVNAGKRLGLHENTAKTLASEAILKLREARMSRGKEA